MASKATVQRQKSSEKVAAAGRTHQALIVTALSSRYGETVGAAAGVLAQAVTLDMEVKTAEMVRCDDAHEAELRDDPVIRGERDEAAAALHDTLTTTRSQLGTVGGEAYVSALGFSGKTPSDPVEVLRLGRIVTDNLAAVPAPASLIPGYTLDPNPWRASLLPLVENLDGLTARTAVEEREAEASLTAKYAAIEAYDQSFSTAANLVGALLAAAGETELARRVRPSTRRPGRTSEEAPAEGETAETPAE